MSSIGRPVKPIDLTPVVSSLNKRVEANEVSISTNTANISTNTTNIATNTTDITTINTTIGDDSLDPKTGIFLKLQHLREGHEIIPNYDYTGVYLILLNDLIDTADDPNVIINNSTNQHLNEILLDKKNRFIRKK